VARTNGVDRAFVESTIELGLRVSAVTAGSGVLGFVIAMIARNTGAAIGIALDFA